MKIKRYIALEVLMVALYLSAELLIFFPNSILLKIQGFERSIDMAALLLFASSPVLLLIITIIEIRENRRIQKEKK